MFGMGFTEILIIAVIAILFLGPDKLPSAMVEVAKFLQNAKNTLGNVKSTIEEEMEIKDIKEEALAYKKELLDAKEKVRSATDIKAAAAKLTSLEDDSDWADDGFYDEPKQVIKETQQDSSGEAKTVALANEPQEVTLKKKKKKKKVEEDNTDV